MNQISADMRLSAGSVTVSPVRFQLMGLMQRISRMFEVIQLLRGASKPLSAEALGETLEVSKRTIYRDIAALQAMRVPIEGEAGVGYIMRRGYDLPPLNFDVEEVEALRVGLLMLARTGDGSLKKAASRIIWKIEALQAEEPRLHVSPFGAPSDDPEKGCVSVASLRDAIRSAQKLRLTYRNEGGEETTRIVRPVAVIYHLESVLIAAWCELRNGFRHFRTDRIWACNMLDENFREQAVMLHKLWTEGDDTLVTQTWVRD